MAPRTIRSILLVCPRSEFDVSTWLDRTAQSVSHQKAYVVPLHLATIAALTPERYRVQIWDELIQGPAEDNLDKGYDLVGITAYSRELDRALEIADSFRARGVPVALGGAGITTDPHLGKGRSDAVFIGEAEITWPRFLADLEAGIPAAVYEGEGSVDLALSPPPQWESIAHLLADNYKTGAVQTNRGCPFDCEFCNVWVKFGRTIRTKPVPQAMAEIAALEKLGMKRVIFSTDNFIGNPNHAKEVLRALIPLNASFTHPLAFTGEVTINVARDDEMLHLMADANFSTLFIGIESTNLDSLKETRKRQNTRGDLADECRTIASYGLSVIGSLIVGFDNDSTGIFDAQFRFVQDALIPIPRLNVLRANSGTDLYDRLRAEGRLIDLKRTFPGDPLVGLPMRSNVLFRTMSRVEMYQGFLGLLERVWDWRNFRDRIMGFIDNLDNLPDRRPDERLRRVAEDLVPVMHTIPQADRAIIDEVHAHAAARAPALLWNVASMMMMQAYQAANLPRTREAIGEQLRLEHEIERAGGPVMVPPLSLSA